MAASGAQSCMPACLRHLARIQTRQHSPCGRPASQCGAHAPMGGRAARRQAPLARLPACPLAHCARRACIPTNESGSRAHPGPAQARGPPFRAPAPRPPPRARPPNMPPRPPGSRRPAWRRRARPPRRPIRLQGFHARRLRPRRARRGRPRRRPPPPQARAQPRAPRRAPASASCRPPRRATCASGRRTATRALLPTNTPHWQNP